MGKFLQFYGMTTEHLLRLKKNPVTHLCIRITMCCLLEKKTCNKYKQQFSHSRKFLLIQNKSFS